MVSAISLAFQWSAKQAILLVEVCPAVAGKLKLCHPQVDMMAKGAKV